MRRQGYALTRWADDWVVTCRTRAEAESALARAEKILGQLGVALNPAKTRIVHVAHGFEFLGFKIQRGKGNFQLAREPDQVQTEPAEPLRHPYAEVVAPIQGPDQGSHAQEDSFAHGRMDRNDQPDHPRMGQLPPGVPM